MQYKFNIEKFNNERGEELAKAKQTENGETIIAVCDKFSKRVHENIPAAGDLLIMDGTANLDRNDTKEFHLMCPSPVGGLPLGTLIMTRADEETIAAALELYKALLQERAFYGRGKDLGPVLMITDDDAMSGLFFFYVYSIIFKPFGRGSGRQNMELKKQTGQS